MTEPQTPRTPDQPEAGEEIQLISDGDSLAILGHSDAVELFLVSEGLASRDRDLPRPRALLGAGAELAQTAAVIASASGRWVQITAEDARAIGKWGLMKNTETGLSMGVVYAKGDAQGIKKIVQFTANPGTLKARALNPLALANVAALMQQMSMQQAMDDISDYLATIDEKVDDIIRGQKDAVIADMIGVDLVIEEAMTLREQVGRVGDVTWSKVQGTSATVARTQAYALRQLDALAQKLESKADMNELVRAAKEAGAKVQEWIVILARCFQLQDAIAVLELDRVMGTSPEELDQHRIGLKAARQNRLNTIACSTTQLVDRMNAAAATANTKVLFNPFDAPAVVRSTKTVVDVVVEFHDRLGLRHDREALEAKRWVESVVEAKEKALDAGSRGLDAAGRLGSDTLSRATEPFRAVDVDGDGIPDRPRALAAAEDAGTAIKGMATGATRAASKLFQAKRSRAGQSQGSESEPSAEDS